MAEVREKPLLGKVIIKGKIYCETGLHIGAARESLEIGGLDAPVIRDPVSREPYIPGSSLKGKMRSLLEKRERKPFNKYGGQNVWRHECADLECSVCRLFGSAGGKEGENLPARLIVRDCYLTEESIRKLEKIETGLQFTEWKFENSLDRITAASNPRQIERVPKGSEFLFEIVYNVETKNEKEVREDLSNILNMLNLLQDDYLGGHGSRGYGKVRFEIEIFESRKIDFYTIEKKEEKEKTFFIPELEGKTPADCKIVIESLVSFLFK